MQNDKRGIVVLISATIGFLMGMQTGRASAQFAIDRMSTTLESLARDPGNPVVQTAMITTSIVSGFTILGAALIPAITVFVITRIRKEHHGQ